MGGMSWLAGLGGLNQIVEKKQKEKEKADFDKIYNQARLESIQALAGKRSKDDPTSVPRTNYWNAKTKNEEGKFGQEEKIKGMDLSNEVKKEKLRIIGRFEIAKMESGDRRDIANASLEQDMIKFHEKYGSKETLDLFNQLKMSKAQSDADKAQSDAELSEQENEAGYRNPGKPESSSGANGGTVSRAYNKAIATMRLVMTAEDPANVDGKKKIIKAIKDATNAVNSDPGIDEELRQALLDGINSYVMSSDAGDVLLSDITLGTTGESPEDYGFPDESGQPASTDYTDIPSSRKYKKIPGVK